MAPQRSNFVTAVAWIFIVVAALATCISLIQNLFLAIAAAGAQGAQRSPHLGVPELAAFATSYVRVFFLATLALSALWLAASIGLLRRQNWARLVTIGILVLAMLASVAMLALVILVAGGVALAPLTEDGLGAAAAIGFVLAFQCAFGLGILALLGWLVRRLASARVRAEFVPERP